MATVLGRQRAVGIGKETTKGTAVAPTFWFPQKDITIEDGISRIWDNSGLGTRNGAFAGDTSRESSSGGISGNVYHSSFGLLALLALGSVVTTNHTATGVKIHTITVGEDLPAATLSTKDGNESLRSPYAMINNLQILFDLEDYVRFTSEWLGRRGVAIANTPAFSTVDKGFRPQDVVIKIADSVAGLSAGTALRVESGSFAVNNALITRGQLGTVQPDYYPGVVETAIELRRLHLDTTVKDMLFNNTPKAMSIKMTRSDVTIGTGTPTNPSIEIVTQPSLFSNWQREGGLDDLKDETISLQPLYAVGAGKQFDIIVTTTTATL